MELEWIWNKAEARKDVLVFGDLTGTGASDAAVVLHCYAGGVDWPQIIAFYAPGPKLLAWSYMTNFNLPGKGPDEGNANVWQIVYRDEGIAVDWSTQDGGDAAATSTLDYSAVLRFSGHKIVATDLTGTTELQTVEAFVGDLRKGDEAAASTLAAPGLGPVAATQVRYYPSALTTTPKCYGLNDASTMPAPLAPLIDGGSPTEVMPVPDRICALASSDPGANWVVLGMRHTGFRQWQVIWIHVA